MNTAIRSPEHLKEWVVESGRKWIVLNGEEMVEALPFPHGHDALMQVIMAYRDHRALIESGEYRMEEDPRGEPIRVPVMKGERLTIQELDRCIRALIGEASQLDPKWSIENPAL